jgi:hypothetical protein
MVNLPPTRMAGHTILPPIVDAILQNTSQSSTESWSMIGRIDPHLVYVCITASLESQNSPKSERWCR